MSFKKTAGFALLSKHLQSIAMKSFIEKQRCLQVCQVNIFANEVAKIYTGNKE